MRTATDKTIVVFRVWRDTGDVIALFPTIPADLNGWYCESYMHIGQHGGADFDVVMRATRLASRRESFSLRRELRLIGYRLTTTRQTTRRIHEQRRAEARRFRTTTVT